VTKITITFKRKHRSMIFTVWKILITVVKTENSRKIEPELIKMTHITFTTWRKTNDALCKQQSMPNDAALYINGIGNGFIAFAWTIWRFLCAYAGLLVNGFDDNGVCLLRRLDQKTLWFVCAFHAHRHASSSDLDFRSFWRCLDLWLWHQWLPQFLVQNEPRERQRRFKLKSKSIPSNCYKKDRGWQSCWVGIWRQMN
jgi:hypothetical protein